MFPLLVHLLEKCELATKSGDGQSSASLNEELKTFLQRLQRGNSKLFGEDKETNDLVSLNSKKSFTLSNWSSGLSLSFPLHL